MIRRVLGTLLAALTVSALAAAAPANAVQAADFTGIVALSNCSGSVVRPPQALDSDPALVMSNGHCVKLMGANEVIRNQSSSRTFTLLSGANATTLGTLRATKISYATMHGTDVSFYQLNQTYAQIRQRFPQFRPLTLSTTHPTQGAGIQVVSGFWKRIWTCNVDGFVFQLKEDVWTWNDSVRYTSACDTIGGTSGSPVIDGTGKVVAINNTGNENGERCTLDNPCEVSQDGQITVRQGINYSQEIFQISACIGAGNQFNLTLPGCTLPR